MFGKKESLCIPFTILWKTFLMRILFKWIHSHFECIYSFMNKFETIFPKEQNSQNGIRLLCQIKWDMRYTHSDFSTAPKSYLCHDQSKKFHTRTFIKMYSRLPMRILKMGKSLRIIVVDMAWIRNVRKSHHSDWMEMSCTKVGNRLQSGLICPFAI